GLRVGVGLRVRVGLHVGGGLRRQVGHRAGAADEVIAIDVDVAPAVRRAGVVAGQRELVDVPARLGVQHDAGVAVGDVDAVGRRDVVGAAGVGAGLVGRVVVQR